MIGIGTDKVSLTSHKYIFSSLLGSNANSWGFSFRGLIQHNNCMKYYGQKFVQGCIIGVYLDLFKGHLEFYLNRRSLGIAYRNIPIDKDIQLYPMACSTSAKSAIKLLNSSMYRESLQFRCMKIIGRNTHLVEVTEIIEHNITVQFVYQGQPFFLLFLLASQKNTWI